MIGDKYWDHRLHRWGAWLATGSGRLSSTPLARLRALGVKVQTGSEREAPMVHEAERETDQMIHRLPGQAADLLDAYYRRLSGVHELAVSRGRHPDTIRAAIKRSHGMLQRMLDERRRGQRQPQPKAVIIRGEVVRGRGRTIASAVGD